MKINSETVKQLSDLLHKQNEEELLVVYYGIAEVLVTKYIEQSGESRSVNENKVYLKRLVSNVAETAIIDRSLLEKICLNVYGFKYHSKPTMSFLMDNRWDMKSYQDVIGLSSLMSSDVLEKINVNFQLFRDAMTRMANAYPDIVSSDILGD